MRKGPCRCPSSDLRSCCSECLNRPQCESDRDWEAQPDDRLSSSGRLEGFRSFPASFGTSPWHYRPSLNRSSNEGAIVTPERGSVDRLLRLPLRQAGVGVAMVAAGSIAAREGVRRRSGPARWRSLARRSHSTIGLVIGWSIRRIAVPPLPRRQGRSSTRIASAARRIPALRSGASWWSAAAPWRRRRFRHSLAAGGDGPVRRPACRASIDRASR